MFDIVVVSFSGTCFFFQAEDGIRDLVRSRGLGDVYKRQTPGRAGLLARRAGRRRATLLHQRSRRGSRTSQALSLIHI